MPYFPLHRHLLKFHYNTGCCDMKYEKSIERVWTFCCVSELYRFITVVEIEDLFSRVVVQEAYIRCRIKIWCIMQASHIWGEMCAFCVITILLDASCVFCWRSFYKCVNFSCCRHRHNTRKKLHFLMNRKQDMIWFLNLDEISAG